MSNIFLKVNREKLTFSNLRFSNFKIFVTASIFGELQLTQILKPKSPCILSNKNINFNENETESKMTNPIHSFRERTLVFLLI